jgi:hypothetical protein
LNGNAGSDNLSQVIMEDSSINVERRIATLGVLGGFALLATGCTTKPMRPASAAGIYCVRHGKGHRHNMTCAPMPIPSAQIEAEAKRFDPAPDWLTVYLVRDRWGDTRNLIRVSSDGGPAADTVPESFVRWRLPPGRHQLTATWPEGSAGLDIEGVGGDLIFVEVIGSVWFWGSKYRLERGEVIESRRRAARLRLIADVR